MGANLLLADLTFSSTHDEFGKEKVVDLIPNGRNIPVTDDNKVWRLETRDSRLTRCFQMKYLELITEHRLTKSIKAQIQSFLKGFRELIPQDSVSIFNEQVAHSDRSCHQTQRSSQEMELLICGLPDIDINDLKANTEYRHYRATDEVIRWFWQIVEDFDR